MDKDFLTFLFRKIYKSSFNVNQDLHFADLAFESCLADIQYHYPEKSSAELFSLIKFGTGWLNTFLYRLGNTVFQEDAKHPLLGETHWLIKELCASEIYFSIHIGRGLYIRHGEGMVIGSRCKIGEGFVIHQHCTIGHKYKLGNGPFIGNNVEMGVGSSILGDCTIGDNVMVGAHSLVINTVPANSKVVGIPAKLTS